jgi:hypothetical protein
VLITLGENEGEHRFHARFEFGFEHGRQNLLLGQTLSELQFSAL